MSRSSPRVLCVYRHPTPYRDPLFDRLAALPGLDLEVLYLARSFPQTPWQRDGLAHAHRFPRAWLQGRVGDLEVGLHPSALTTLWRERPDAVVLSGWIDPTVLALAAACRALGIPYVLGGESFLPGGDSLASRLHDRTLKRWIVRGARAWLPAGSRARENFVRLGADADRCHPFPTSPDARAWIDAVRRAREGTPGPRARLGVPDEGVLCFVARLVPVKAPEVLLDAFASLHRDRPGVRLLLAGDGPLRETLERHPAAGHVDFLGFRQPRDVVDVLAASDVFVLPSRFEPWGAAACEALAAGLPVVLSSAVGCAPDVLDPEACGALVPGTIVSPDDADALAAALARWLDPPEDRAAIAEAARARSLAWGHDLNAHSFLAALADAGLDVGVARGASGLDAIPA